MMFAMSERIGSRPNSLVTRLESPRRPSCEGDLSRPSTVRSLLPERRFSMDLPRLKDSKVMSVADEDAPEDPKRQETIVGGCAGDSFRGVCVCEEGHPGKFK